MNEKFCDNDPLSAWHPGRAVGSLRETGAPIAPNAGYWKNLDTGNKCKQDGVGRVTPSSATWWRRSEIKSLACLCICLVLWMSNIPDLLAQTLGRSVRSMQRQMAPTPERTLRFGKDGKFQISVFEDLHFAEGEIHLARIISESIENSNLILRFEE